MKVILVIQLFFREACFYQMTVEKLFLGIANRKLVNDDNLLIGTNFFYGIRL